MQRQWYRQSEHDICAYFDVNPQIGLTKKDALNRLVKFGINKDARLSAPLQKALQVTVVRDGKKVPVAFSQIALGDIVWLAEGDRVPADLRLTHVQKLTINQTLITGEPLPSLKNTFALTSARLPIKQKCMAFAGSYVVSGSGTGVVVERGNTTLLAGQPNKRDTKLGVKGSVIARRLRKFGVIILRKKALASFRKINTVIIVADTPDATVIDLIRKVQLTRNIDCKFVVDVHKAARLSTELNAGVYDAATKTGNLQSSQFITGLDTANSLELALQLDKAERTVLWVSSGMQILRAFDIATISMVCGDNGRDDVILAADIFTPKPDLMILNRILYGKQ